MKEYIIEVRETTHPSVLKFEANQPLVTKGNYEYKNIDEAKDSPLAQQLFYLPFIKGVYISGNFIALERFDIVKCEDVKDEVAQQLVEYLNTGSSKRTTTEPAARGRQEDRRRLLQEGPPRVDRQPG